MINTPLPAKGFRFSVLFLIATGLAILAQSASAQIYRWTDENGKVIFSDSPPPKGKVETVKGKPTPPSEAPKVAADAKSPGSTGGGAGKTSADQDADEARKKELAEYCRASRFQLGDLEGGLQMYTRDSNGNRILMNAEARAAETAKLKAARDQAKCD